MAGIGFELNKILRKEGFSSLIRAYAYAGLIGSGPWLAAVLTLGLLGTALSSVRGIGDVRVFFVSISLIYGITLILTGPVQMVLTRYAADQEFMKRPQNIFPTFIFCLAWVALIFSAIGAVLFVGFVPGPMLFRCAAAMLTMLVAAIWITSIFLTALKKYHAVLLGFAVGSASSFFAAVAMGKLYGLAGAMLGFTIGHAILLLFLCAIIFRELGNLEVGRPDFLVYFRKYWELALGGFLYNLGIWIDKFLYWWCDPESEQVAGILFASPVFDRVVYFSFLTIAPGMAVFLLKLETDFATKNAMFYDHVLRKGTLDQILTLKEEMILSLREGFTLLVKVQGLSTGLLILCADRILGVLDLGAVQAGVFQVSLIGVFLLVLFLAMQTILYYLDKRRDAMMCCLVMTVLNGLVTLWCIRAGEQYYGIGFLVATGAAMLLAAHRVNYHVRNLDFDTFTSQPIYG